VATIATALAKVRQLLRTLTVEAEFENSNWVRTEERPANLPLCGFCVARASDAATLVPGLEPVAH